MKSIHIGLFLCMFCLIPTFAQQTHNLSGYVFDKHTKTPLQDVVVKATDDEYTLTNNKGYFIFTDLPAGTYSLQVILMGYKGYFLEANLNDNKEMKILIEEDLTSLSEVVVHGKTHKREAKEISIVSKEISHVFLQENRENSLMQTLKKLPGVSTISIGSGQSKPVIRGLGFNRVAVVQNGIKHEAQQWGTDHGLEIDQYGIDEIQIIKGPASLMYGSDAIAGVINIRQDIVPKENSFSGEVNLLAESNNDLLGISTGIQSRKDKWYYRARLTFRDYADYKVPVNTVNYENYVFHLHNHNLRNTAGKEANASFSIGYVSDRFESKTFISNVYGKNGFFANAHGMEVRISDIDYDASNRDIDLPYHKLNHFKITNTSTYNFDNHNLKIDFGFQNNLREEYSEPAAHGYMPKPKANKERKFNKNTFTLNVSDEFSLNKHEITVGANVEYQDNKIGGWGFLIPNYKRFVTGTFAYDKYELKNNLFLLAGIRYDFGVIDTEAYYDWYRSEISNNDGTTSLVYLKRAKNQTLFFNNLSTSIGLSYIQNKMSYKFNLGKSFRMPLANELASDGVNYHMFRYEKGNSELDAESSYQIDAEVAYETDNLNVSVTPFVNYFDNFIYLNPTPNYFETIQIYEYTQAKVFRFGGEINVGVKPSEKLHLDASLEYVYSRQTSGPKKNFSLPFSPPLSTLFSATYLFKDIELIKNPQFRVDLRLTATQEDIVPPEAITQGYAVLGISFLSDVNLFKAKKMSQLRIKLNNVLNTEYYDHTSFYRLIDVPEVGTNLSVSLTIPF